ncbi:GNAT family N-acetyltransferase [Demequina capsici]|uniref:GNAT family N-acetyltransferase n=1 Tax=Demequina capsici TaxID=3075620 RepID=A0AA96J9D1_9MICO|nr:MULTISPECIES: GNAT family N-acetyltransferase [unclassified Demequina]WNM23388.1 GNAT family N-acetyltransferase [Demequina sp. OYTSA14]WNM26265.1 GNAT family N-acetyltransferase [Demequina sp. PMTSA13]
MTWDVPTRIVTARLEIRRYTAADAEALTEVAARNRDHLLRYMVWAEAEPQTVRQRLEFIAKAGAEFDAGVEYTMGIFERAGGAFLGGSGFHVKTAPVGHLEIGYWIDADREGHGYVTEATAALARVALEHCGSPYVAIAHAPTNVRSAAVPQRLGFTRQPGTDKPRCTDAGSSVTPVEWHATVETLAGPAFASHPRPSLEDADGGTLTWHA